MSSLPMPTQRPTSPLAYPESSLDRRLLRFADPWSDRGVADRTFPYHAMAGGGPWRARELGRRAVGALRSAGFSVAICDVALEVAAGADGRPDPRQAVREFMMNPQAASPEAWANGLLVGERALRVDAARRRTAIRILVTFTLLFVVLVPLGWFLGYDPALRLFGGWLYLAGGLSGIAALFSLGPTRAYESDLAVIVYRAVGGAVAPGVGTPDSPRLYQVTVSVARVASTNAAGRRGGRNLRVIRPGHAELSAVPQRILGEVITG